MNRTAVVGGLYLAVVVLALADALLSVSALRRLAVVLIITFVALELPRIHWPQRVAGGLLFAGGLLAGWQQSALAVTFWEGAARALPLLVLFAAVMSLQVPALTSPAFRRLGESVAHQPPGRRALMLALAGHGLGAVLNLAGLQLVASLIDPRLDPPVRRRLTLAVMRGFSAAVCWSPFFVGMAVVLTMLPQTSWLEVAPFGLPVAATLIAAAWGHDRLMRRRALAPEPAAGAAQDTAPRPGTGTLLRVAGVFLALGVPVIGLGEAAGLGIPIAIGLAAPPLALAWQASLPGGVAPLSGGGAGLTRAVVGRLPGLRDEAVLFLGATVFGTGVAAAVGDAAPAIAAPLAAWPVPVKVVGLTLLGTALAGVGVHPVILAIGVGQILPPSTLGLAAPVVALMLVVAWATGTAMSPFSATTMQVARLLELSVFRVGWGWNAGYCLPASALAALVIAGVERALAGA